MSAYFTKERNQDSVIYLHIVVTYFTVLTAIFAQEFKNTLIKTYHDIVCHEHASSCIGMSITRSTNLDQIYVSQFGLTNRVIADFLPDEFPKASSPASSHLFNNVSEGQKYDRIECLSHHSNECI